MALAGKSVNSITGIEMAFSEPDAGPLFADQNFKGVQLACLWLEAQTGIFEIRTYPNDDGYGLSVVEISREQLIKQSQQDSDRKSIFRHYQLTGLELGEILRVRTENDDLGAVCIVHLVFEESTVSIVAGEIYDDGHDALRFCKPDESLLLFVDPDEISRVSWYQ